MKLLLIILLYITYLSQRDTVMGDPNRAKQRKKQNTSSRLNVKACFVKDMKEES